MKVAGSDGKKSLIPATPLSKNVDCVDDEVVTFYPGCRNDGRSRHDCNEDSEQHCDAKYPEINVRAKLTVCIHD